MSMWTAIVIIVAIGTLSELYRARLKSQSSKSEERFDGVQERIARIEDRMANLETIVLERERSTKFSELGT